MPGDPKELFVEPNPHYPGEFMIAHKKNGDCFYLGETGCTIHSNKPLRCREMDCRNIARLSQKAAEKLNVVEVWKRGRELIANTRK